MTSKLRRRIAGALFFANYPAFRQATVAQIVNLQQPAPEQLYWPDLDIDIELAALDEPERFPLTYVTG